MIEMIVHVVDIGEIVNHYCLHFLFIMYTHGNVMIHINWRIVLKYQLILMYYVLNDWTMSYNCRGHHGHDRMVAGFITTCAISGYHH